MPENELCPSKNRPRTPWNKGKLIGAKPPLRPRHVWAIRTKLQIELCYAQQEIFEHRCYLRFPFLVVLRRGLELLAELGEFVGADVADRPEVHAAVAPAADVEALDGLHLRRLMRRIRGLRHKQLDAVGAALGDNGADAAVIYIIEAA